MPARAIVAHRMPGRIRLRIPEQSGNAVYFSDLEQALSNLPEVRLAKANPRAASITLESNGSAHDILQSEQMRKLLVIEHSEPDEGRPASLAATRQAPFNLVSGREITPMFMTGALLAALGAAQILRGQVLAPAVTVFWYAIQAFRQAEAPNETREPIVKTDI